MLIEKGVPVPAGMAVRRGRPAKYRWDDMDVGDSFWTEAKSDRLRAWANSYAVRRGKEFLVLPEKGGARAWRIA